MTKIKLCGLSHPCDIEAANEWKPEYIGFVLAPKSRRYISPEQAANLKSLLDPKIKAVGVFVDESPETIANLLEKQIIDIAQLHGTETEAEILQLKKYTAKPIIKAFRIGSKEDLRTASACSADFILLDSGAGTGTAFDWGLIGKIDRPYFLAGGLSPENVSSAIQRLHPYAVDVSSGIETGGKKDRTKMAAFICAARKEGRL